MCVYVRVCVCASACMCMYVRVCACICLRECVYVRECGWGVRGREGSVCIVWLSILLFE